jgi:hypothetical protein
VCVCVCVCVRARIGVRDRPLTPHLLSPRPPPYQGVRLKCDLVDMEGHWSRERRGVFLASKGSSLVIGSVLCVCVCVSPPLV